jgi:predicted nucleotidyltransferase
MVEVVAESVPLRRCYNPPVVALAPLHETEAVAAPAAQLEPQLERLAARCLADRAVVAVLLLGSAARGELVAATVDGRLELFGDIELFVVTDGRLPGPRRRLLAEELARIGADFGYRSPLFHVDVAVRERARLGSLPPRVFTYELRANARLLAGEDVRSEIRPVTLADLDRPNTREILMKRLWALAEAMPLAWLEGAALDELAWRSLGVALRRNPLDVTTVLLPEAGVLLPTYRARVDHWADHPELPFRPTLDEALGADSGLYLRRCLADRAAASPPAPSSYGDAIAAIEGALAWLLGCRPGEVVDIVARRSRSPFGERPSTAGEILATARAPSR